jgi:hypothetical protein
MVHPARKRIRALAVRRLSSSQRTERLPADRPARGLALFVVPVLVHFEIPHSPRRLLRRGQTQAAIDTVNQFIRRCGNRVGR